MRKRWRRKERNVVDLHWYYHFIIFLVVVMILQEKLYLWDTILDILCDDRLWMWWINQDVLWLASWILQLYRPRNFSFLGEFPFLKQLTPWFSKPRPELQINYHLWKAARQLPFPNRAWNTDSWWHTPILYSQFSLSVQVHRYRRCSSKASDLQYVSWSLASLFLQSLSLHCKYSNNLLYQIV